MEYSIFQGQSPFPVPDVMVQKLRENAHQKDYLPSRGLPALREAAAEWFSKKYHGNFGLDDILIGPGNLL